MIQEEGDRVGTGGNVAAPENSHGLYSLLSKQPTHTPVQRERVCVFISHKDVDTPAAIEIGNYIMEDSGFDIYLDVYDRTLQKADNDNDLEGIVASIHRGISYASHLLCVISDKSQDSWWVPYEIGFAQANDVNTASIIVKNTEWLPTYLRVKESPVFFGIEAFDQYMIGFGRYGGIFENHGISELQYVFEYYNVR